MCRHMAVLELTCALGPQRWRGQQASRWSRAHTDARTKTLAHPRVPPFTCEPPMRSALASHLTSVSHPCIPPMRPTPHLRASAPPSQCTTVRTRARGHMGAAVCMGVGTGARGSGCAGVMGGAGAGSGTRKSAGHKSEDALASAEANMHPLYGLLSCVRLCTVCTVYALCTWSF